MIDSCIGPKVENRWLGTIPYLEAVETMHAAWREVKERPDKMIFLGCEHPAVITLGRQATAAEIVANPKAAPNKSSAPVPVPISDLPIHQTDRGGQATVHSEGQLVVYPIVHLRYLEWGLKDFIETLLLTTSQMLQTWGIPTTRAEPAGLQTSQGKLAFMGLRVDQGITRHGLSLNISNDLGYFSGIRACGVSQAKIDKVANHLKNPPSGELAFKDWQAQLNLVINSQLPSGFYKGSVGAVGSAFP